MILVDANLLIYASVKQFAEHKAAYDWLDQRLNGDVRVGLPWQSLLAFLRVTTNPRLLDRPQATASAWWQIEEWLSGECVWIPQPTERHPTILGKLLAGQGIQANLVHDAHLAALAVEHGLELCSTDGDFARFPELRWTNPIV